ncbi:MAG: S4 domain-containing protein [Buchnera aphidicola (Schlechtendalia peitan)]
MLPVSFLHINANNEKQRIDNFLHNKFKKLPKSVIYKILRTGQIRINKARVQPSYKLKIGDYIRIPPIENFHKKKKYN